MRTVTLQFRIPSWFPKKRVILDSYRTWKYKLFPFRCQDCGIKVNYKFPKYEYNGPGRRKSMLQPLTHILCADCLAVRIFNTFDKFHPSNEKCDCCFKVKQTIGSMRNKNECDITFGSRWWNGHNFCKQCLIDTVMYGTKNSSIHAGSGKCVNEVGALIPREYPKNLKGD